MGMFDGFMEGFTGKLGEGIAAQDKNRLEAQRDAARALREENIMRFQVANSNEQNQLSREASAAQSKAGLDQSAAQHDASLKQSADQFRTTNQRLTDAESDQIFQNDAKLVAEEKRLKAEQDFKAGESKKERDKDIKVAGIHASSPGGEGNSPASIKEMKALVQLGIVPDLKSAAAFTKTGATDIPGKIADATIKAIASRDASIMPTVLKDGVRVPNPKFKTDEQISADSAALINGIYGAYGVNYSSNAAPTVSPVSSTPVRSSDSSPGYGNSGIADMIMGNRQPPSMGGSTPKSVAPSSAIAALRANPSLKGDFFAKYGYLPQ